MSNSASTDLLSIIVRLFGLALLVIGLYIGIKVIFEAWHLYEQPQRIERFADAIEHGSNLDALLASVTTGKSASLPDQSGPATATKAKKTTPQLKITYFLAWGIVVVLLMVIGSLASTAIKTGGQLALYDLQVKQIARQLLTDAKKAEQHPEYRQFPKD
jgi:disulfide bond formation protein DsbB